MRRKILVRKTVSLYETRTNLSALVERVSRREAIVIAKSGKPKAVLAPLEVTRDPVFARYDVRLLRA